MKNQAPHTEPTLLKLAWPMFVEQGLRSLIGTVDTLMVSHISDNAVAALGVATQVVVLAIISFNFIGIGASVVVTHHLGAQDSRGAARIARAAVGVNTWVGLIVSLVVAAAASPLLLLMQLPLELLPYAAPFLTWMGGTLFIEAQNVAMSAVLRAHGRTRSVMLVTLAQNVVNLAGNCLFLFGLLGMPQLGVPGVALSGVISRAAAFLILRHLLARRTGVRLSPKDYLIIPMSAVRRILRIGLPAAGENLSYWLAMMVVTSFVSRLGATSLSALTYSRQITIWVILFAVSIGLGTEILVGRMIGAGDFERAYQVLLKSLRQGLLLAATVASAMALAAPYLMPLFTQDPAVIAQAVVLQRLGIGLETGRVFNVVVINGLRATGDARFPLIMGACCIWSVWVPLAWLLGLGLEWKLTGVCVAMVCDEWLRGLLNYSRWHRRAWLESAQASHAALSAQEGQSVAPAAAG